MFAGMTVAENLALGGRPPARRHGRRPCARWCDCSPSCASAWSDVGGNFSGGQQQMLAIGRGLMSGPRLLMLDEPSLGLSPLLVAEVFRLVRRCATRA